MGSKSKKRKRSKKAKRKKTKRKKKKRYSSSSSDSSDADSSSQSSEPTANRKKQRTWAHMQTLPTPSMSNNSISQAAAAAALSRAETAEQRKKRRLKKKEDKLQRKLKKEETLYFGYSNESNPFGDSRLTSTFIWEKKFEAQGLTVGQIRAEQKKKRRAKQKELHEEIMRTRDRRRQREEEKEIEEAMRLQLQKELEREENAGWQEREEEFHRKNAVIRSNIRIREGRAQPVDLIAKNIHILYNVGAFLGGDTLDVGDEANAELRSPVQIMEPLQVYQLKELLEEIELYLSMPGAQIEHWNMVKKLAEHLLSEKQEEVEGGTGAPKGCSHVYSDVYKMVESLSTSEVNELLAQAEIMVRGDVETGAAVDVEYWESVLAVTRVVSAKTFLKEKHDLLMQRRMRKIMEKQRTKTDAHMKYRAELAKANKLGISSLATGDPNILGEDQLGVMAMPLIPADDPRYKELLAVAFDPAADGEDIQNDRLLVLEREMEKMKLDKSLSNPLARQQMSMSAQQRIAIPEDRLTVIGTEENFEDQFNDTVEVSNNTAYWWQEKYRPRKPRFFNRVKTGYSWNKYNQTHYDVDNPPPKIVSGYKFNIFYPDLIDPTKTPSYKVYETPGSEYATIVFSAGPPYEDVAFKIVNNEWEANHKRGFRNRFDKGIYSLYFNFRRYRYRR